MNEKYFISEIINIFKNILFYVLIIIAGACLGMLFNLYLLIAMFRNFMKVEFSLG